MSRAASSTRCLSGSGSSEMKLMGDAAHQQVGVDHLDVGELALGSGREELGLLERGAPAAAAVGRGGAAVDVDEVVDRVLNRIAQVADVIDDREVAGGPQEAVDLGERGGAVEPVKGLRDGDGIGARIGKAGALRGAGSGVGAGCGALE